MKVIVCSMIMGACVSAHANTYCNPRFNFCVDHPASLKTQYPESDNGDGRVFKLPGSTADIRVYGTNTPSVIHDSDQQYLDSLKSSYAVENSVTYERKKQNSYTVSGYTAAGNIFYNHTVVKDGEAIIVHFDYPISEKKKMNTIIKHMTSSLRFK